MNPSLTRQFFFNHFEGRSTPLQIEILKEWLATAANQELYYAYLQEWERGNPQVLTDASQAYSRFLTKRATTSVCPAEAGGRLRRFRRIVPLAAACLTLVACGLAYLTHPYWNRRILKTGPGQTRTLLLPDRTRVVLHENASIQVPRFAFLPFDRKVKLQGDAEFSVTRQPGREPFLVALADASCIRVLGTEFAVQQNSGATRIRLDEGKICFEHSDGKNLRKLFLDPGEQVLYDPRTFRATKIPPAGTIERQEKEWVLTDVPLAELAGKIEREFGVKIIIDNPKHARLILNGIVPTESLDVLIRSLAETLELKIVRDRHTIRIR